MPSPLAPARTSSPRRGLNGALLKAFRAQDLQLTVTRWEELGEHLIRLRVDLDGLLERDEVYPTYWLRLWFTTPAGAGHQRAYTVVDPDPATGTGSLEFYLHPGTASDWARAARPGDRIDASVLNGKSPLEGDPSHLLLVGDGASVPAFADLLRRAPEVPATVLLERGYADDEQALPIAPHPDAEVHWLDRDGSLETAALTHAARSPAGTRAVIATEARTTRRLGAALRKEHGWPKEQVHAVAYWRRT